MLESMTSQDTLQQLKIHFEVMDIEAAAEKMGISSMEMYNRLKRVDLIEQLLFDCYEVLHSQSIKHVAEDVIEALSNWEKKNNEDVK